MLQLGRAGRIKYLLPGEAPFTLEFIRLGWTPLVSVADILDNAKGAAQLAKVEALVLTVGVAANKDWINENPNTALRFVSAMFRTIDQVLANRKLMSVYTPFLNSVGGTNLTPANVYTIFTRLDPLTPWGKQGKYFVDRSSAYHYKNAYSAQTAALVERKVLPSGEYPPDEYIWAGQVYATLNWYRTKADQALAALGGKTLSAAEQKLFDDARKHYRWHNYLDAYRLAIAAQGG
jgi:hypothetical protein